MSRLERSRRQKTLRRKHQRAQIRDIIFIFSSAFIMLGIANEAIIPLARMITTEADVDAADAHMKIISPLPLGNETITATPTPTAIPTITPPQTTDNRAQALYTILSQRHSPLAAYAQYIVQESDANGIDWTLIAAISGKESGFGINMPEGSYNAWGIGGRSFRYFSSWEESIAFEAALLGRDYRYNEYAGIQYKYCPSSECSDTWTQDVTQFSQEIILASK